MGTSERQNGRADKEVCTKQETEKPEPTYVDEPRDPGSHKEEEEAMDKRQAQSRKE